MRLICLILLILLAFPNRSISQSIKWEKTPYGADVSALYYTTGEDATAAERAAGDAYYRNQGYTDVEYLDTYGVLYSSTDRFNCHGWTWFMSEAAGGSGTSDPRVITKSNGTIPYISDLNSYKVVQSESDADIVWWSNGDHSALTTDVAGVWTSKWQNGPLVKHDWDDTPYGTSGLVYYKRCFRKVTGPISQVYDKTHCKVELNDVTVASNVSMSIEYEDYIIIKDGFSTGTGATLDFQPQ